MFSCITAIIENFMKNNTVLSVEQSLEANYKIISAILMCSLPYVCLKFRFVLIYFFHKRHVHWVLYMFSSIPHTSGNLVYNYIIKTIMKLKRKVINAHAWT